MKYPYAICGWRARQLKCMFRDATVLCLGSDGNLKRSQTSRGCLVYCGMSMEDKKLQRCSPHLSELANSASLIQAKGDVPSLSIVAASDFMGTLIMSTGGSLEGVAPMSGTFELAYGGETTSPLYADSTAGT